MGKQFLLKSLHHLLVGSLLLEFGSNAFAYRIEECGLERYASGTSAVCGYKEKRSGHCGVEKYERLPSYDCPGSQRPETYSLFGPAGKTQCRRGDETLSAAQDCTPAGSVSHHSGMQPLTTDIKSCQVTLSCRFPGLKKACRLDTHPPELFNICAHKNHGNKTCEHPSFGEIYKDCARYTREQIDLALDLIAQDVDVAARSMLSAESRFRGLSEDKQGMYCSIKDLENASLPGSDSILLDQKSLYASIFGSYYAGDYFDCTFAGEDSIAIESLDCASLGADSFGSESIDADVLCLTQREYLDSKRWLDEKYSILSDMLTDAVPSSHQSYRNAIESLMDHPGFNRKGGV